MAEHLRSNRLRPALVLCSTALRTRQTLDLLQGTLGPHVDVRMEDELYGADADELLVRLHRVDEGVESVMLIGHNPGLQDLAIELTGDGEQAAIAQLEQKFPTCALATLDVGRIGWDELGRGQAYLADVVLPRHLE
jgi:phosphohistidine phosphatase